MKNKNQKTARRFALSSLLLALTFALPFTAQARPSFPASLQNQSQSVKSADNYMKDLISDGFFSWTDDKFPIKVYFQNADEVPGYRPAFRSILSSSFDTWVQVSDGKLSWAEVNNPKQADIIVSWVNDPTDRPEGTEIGKTRSYTRFSPQTNRGTISKVEMKLLTRLPERTLTDTEVKKAYLHEVGHAFGIAGHSQDRGDIMYYSVSSEHGPSLSDRDVATLHMLYENNRPLASAPVLGQKTSSTTVQK